MEAELVKKEQSILRKSAQEERQEVNREWALRFRKGLAESLSEKKQRADRIT